MKSAEPIMQLISVSKEYGGETPFLALDKVSLAIGEGELISIIGPSGSGKSTMLHLLGCLDKPTGGEIYLAGKAVSKMNERQLAGARREMIGFVFQAFNLVPTLTVWKNVELPLMIKGIEPRLRREIVERNLAAVDLIDKANSVPSQLSGGQKQRVAIARALAGEPKILLADEPTGNLDSKSSAEIIQFIIGLCRKRGITVIFVTHDQRVAEQTDRVIRIMDGKVESDVGKGNGERAEGTGRNGATRKAR
ncbi:putative ABC transporter ATP-binding protein [Candidatus Burarchaeum australiense]|nr:putative ABC transporter ATP-binding protein [Candidatus Burarchaeum australiense]